MKFIYILVLMFGILFSGCGQESMESKNDTQKIDAPPSVPVLTKGGEE